MAPTIEELEHAMTDQRFWSMPVEGQQSAVRDSLQAIYGEQWNQLPDEGKQSAVREIISKKRPYGLIESFVGGLPAIGPLIEQSSLYGRKVEASSLAQQLLPSKQAEEHGAFWQSVEDIAIFAGVGAAIAAFGPEGLLAGTAFEGLSLLSNYLIRGATIGGLYEVGKSITSFETDPLRVAERVGGGVVGGVVGEGLHIGYEALRGRFSELLNPAGNDVNTRRLNREVALTGESMEDFRRRYDNPLSLTSDDVALLYRVAGDRTSQAAQELRNSLDQLRELHRNLERERAGIRFGAEDQASATQRQFEEQQVADVQRESDLTYRQQQAEQTSRELGGGAAELAQRSQMGADVGSEQLSQSIIEGRMQEQLREANLRAQEQMAQEKLRSAGEAERIAALRAEAQRENEAQLLLGQVELDALTRSRGETQVIPGYAGYETTIQLPNLTYPERLLFELLRNEELPNNGFIGREPVTLPIAMINSTTGEPVVVESFRNNQAVLRGGKGTVARTALRGAQNEAEELALEGLRSKERIGGAPSRSESIAILRNRIRAENDIRLANLHDLRSSEVGRATAFNYRRSAVENFLNATNREFAPEVYQQLRSLQPLSASRQVASIENVPTLREANDLQRALSGAGFNEVRLAITPEGTVDVVFTRSASEAEQALSQLYTKYTQYHGIVDPTERSYSGLPVEDHETLGRAFGLTAKQVERYNQFVNQTLDDMISRGIRVPADVSALGVDTIENQVLTKARSAQQIRPDAIVSAEQLQRYEVGDWITIGEGREKQLFRISNIAYNDSRSPIERGYILATEKGQVIPQPISDTQLRTAGAQREASMGIGPAQGTVTLDSPARTLQALLNPESIPAPLARIEPTTSSVERSAREMGMRISRPRGGGFDITQAGTRIHLDSVEDAAQYLNSLRYISEEKRKLLEAFGGERCIR